MKNKLKSITINDNEKFLRQISVPVDILNDDILLNAVLILLSIKSTSKKLLQQLNN